MKAKCWASRGTTGLARATTATSAAQPNSPRDLRAGDLITDLTDDVITGKKVAQRVIAATPAEVTAVDRKIKNVIVSTEHGEFTLAAEARVDVRRTRPTREERVNEYETVVLRKLQAYIGQADEAKAALVDELTNRVSVSYAVRWGYQEKAIQAEILEEAARAVLDRVEDGDPLLEAIEGVKQWVLKKLLNETRGASRSTNAWSNLVEDVQREAYAGILSDSFGGWLSGYDVQLAHELREE